MKTIISSALFIFVSLTATMKSQSQVKKTIPPPSFSTGQKFEYKKTVIIDYLDAKKLTKHQEQTFAMQWEVVGKDASGTTIRARYIKWNERTDDKLNNVIKGFNSEAPDQIIALSRTAEVREDNVRISQLREGILNKPFTIYFDESGAHVLVTGIDTVINEALKNVKYTDAEFHAGYSAGIRSVHTNEDEQNVLEAAFCHYAGKSVALGQGWSKNEEGMGVMLKVGYVAKSMNADSIGIVVLSNAVVHKESELAVQKKGNMVIDAKTGLLLQSATRVYTSPITGGSNTQSLSYTEKQELKLLN